MLTAGGGSEPEHSQRVESPEAEGDDGMPLIATSRPTTPVKTGVGCWMAIRETVPPELIWVVATREALHQLDPNELDDRHVTVFEKHRAAIEDAASAKYDSEGLDPENGEHEGRPVLIVRSDDLT